MIVFLFCFHVNNVILIILYTYPFFGNRLKKTALKKGTGNEFDVACKSFWFTCKTENVCWITETKYEHYLGQVQEFIIQIHNAYKYDKLCTLIVGHFCFIQNLNYQYVI